MFDIDSILECNPQIDREQLNQSIVLSAKLKQAGFARHGYTLKSPYFMDRITVDENRSMHRMGPWK